MQHESQQSEDIYALTHLAIRRMRQYALEETKINNPAPTMTIHDRPKPAA
jgi:hypothetical protein